MYYIVTTTINIPTFLGDYIKDFKAHNHKYLFVVAGDLKTPKGTKEYCDQFEGVVYLDVKSQLKEFKALALTKFIPFNSIDRRNYGYLYCIKMGMGVDDVLVTLDDDNLLKEPDFLGKHGSKTIEGEVLMANVPTWYNAIEEFYDEPIFMRGFSPFDRTKNKERDVIKKIKKSKIAMNQGLWEGNPDVDAIERIKGLRGSYKIKRKRKLALGKNIICPLDSQNTAYQNGFWLTSFLYPFVGRFDDIFSTYITKRLADHLGYSTTYGSPIVTQKRNKHDNYQDFLLELQGMSLTNTFVDWLWSLNLKSKSLLDGYDEIADCLVKEFPCYTLHAGTNGHATKLWSLTHMPIGMKLWLEALDKLNLKNRRLS